MLEQAGPLLRVEIIPDSQLGKRQKAERELISNLPALFLLNCLLNLGEVGSRLVFLVAFRKLE